MYFHRAFTVAGLSVNGMNMHTTCYVTETFARSRQAVLRGSASAYCDGWVDAATDLRRRVDEFYDPYINLDHEQCDAHALAA